MLVPSRCQVYLNNEPFLQQTSCLVKQLLRFLDEYFKKTKTTIVPMRQASKCIPVFSEYAKTLGCRVKERYLQKISVIGVPPANLQTDEFSPECLPPVEVLDLLSYRLLETSYYKNNSSKLSKVFRRSTK